jgi:hypothetical protein
MPARTDHDRIIAIETTVNQLKSQLIGNGQPGTVPSLSKRVGRLEFYLALAIGGFLVIVWFMEYSA